MAVSINSNSLFISIPILFFLRPLPIPPFYYYYCNQILRDGGRIKCNEAQTSPSSSSSSSLPGPPLAVSSNEPPLEEKEEEEERRSPAPFRFFAVAGYAGTPTSNRKYIYSC